MKHILTFGYIGTEYGNERGSRALKHSQEPILSLDQIMSALKLKDKAAQVKVDKDLIQQGKKADEKKILKLWEEITAMGIRWSDLRKKLAVLLELGELLLPIVFEIIYDNTVIEVVDGEHTISVTSADKASLEKLKNSIEKELQGRTSPYGIIGSGKVKLELRNKK